MDWRWSFHNCINFGLTLVENVKNLEGQKKGGAFSIEPLHLMPLAFVLRSGVAPQRCPLSYTGAKVRKVLETSKTFPKKFAKRGKVSHVIGQKKGETSRFPPKCTHKDCILS